MTDNIHIKISRSPAGVMVHSHGSTKFYDLDSWNEFKRMIVDFEGTHAPSIQNYEEHLPVRTPIHANTPTQRGANLEDLA